ncbi:hypothetical protein [Novosphingobium capsulatum]|uniref:hypothetical protein n=1 Tax=Novosphingobium capsulatum TaxID=13688 RepID=UPI000B11D3E5|nr:hypothetical protein [Novosphingobium capsulatum]
MKTEITPKINSGFFVNETELARIKDSVNDQFRKINGGADADFKFEVKYINGGITDFLSIGDIISEENDGSKRVIRLVIRASSVAAPRASVELRLSDHSHEENSDSAPISYSVVSDDQDWTFVTASTLEERVNKIRTSKIARFFANPKLYHTAPMIIAMGVMAYVIFGVARIGDDKIDKIKQIRDTSRDMWEYMYRVDTMKSLDNNFAFVPLLMTPIFIMSLLSEYIFNPILRWFPTYTFYWGGPS